jgi:BlaI family transcriptional regulator, penicillinase repressor
MTEKERCSLPQFNIEKGKSEAFLGPLEARVLETIWSTEKRPLTVREVHQGLGKDSKLAYTTIMTTMNRLFEKELLEREVKSGKGGLYYVYWPKMEKEAFERSAIQGVLGSLIDKFGETVTDCFVEQMSLDKDKLEKLRKELNRMEENKE